MAIEKDTKNWTWVIEKPCPDCGFDAADYPDTSVSSAVRNNADFWPGVLARDTVRARPNESTWSPLEYAAHVRDVLRVYRLRIDYMVEQDDPLYPNWDQDQAAIDDRYDEQNPAEVAFTLEVATVELAEAFDALTAEQWQRPGRRSDGASFTISTIAKYMTHDLVHHRWDVR